MENCPCGNLIPYTRCCGELHTEKRKASTAEEVMRSRYVAYVYAKIDYLIQTTLPKERKYYKEKDLFRWATENNWLKLEIITSKVDFVEFKAYFQDRKKSKVEIHHEKSVFKEIDGIIYYVEAI